ncbi:PACE efflux transporter [Paenalcaligenes sp. Me131]|uniref:PACE efflux transporter n=1 Tax=Paenalcaligenes sp. Me131 TaxID=3392636 RepID=UPI003D2AFED5
MMQARSLADRIRHALMFEAIALMLFIPIFTYFLGYSIASMGVVGMVSSIVATLWNFVYNILYDKVMYRLRGKLDKTVKDRVLHAILFEFGLLFLLIPFISWYLNITIIKALIMDLWIVAFYLFFAFFFNLLYDRVFRAQRHQALVASVETQAAE